MLPDEIQQKWWEAVEALDPLRLAQHVEVLQRAIWRCAEGGSGATLVRFSLDACVSTAAHLSLGIIPSDLVAQGSPDLPSVRDWSRSMDDPFLGEWEQIHAYVCARPMASAGEILREWQRRFPGRFEDTHLNILQRWLREISASLVASQAEPGEGQRNGAIASRTSSEPPLAREDISPLTDAPAVVLPDPEATPSSLQLPPEEEVHWPLASALEVSPGGSRNNDSDPTCAGTAFSATLSTSSRTAKSTRAFGFSPGNRVESALWKMATDPSWRKRSCLALGDLVVTDQTCSKPWYC